MQSDDEAKKILSEIEPIVFKADDRYAIIVSVLNTKTGVMNFMCNVEPDKVIPVLEESIRYFKENPPNADDYKRSN